MYGVMDGEKIEAMRQERGLSRQELAQEAGISVETLRRVERGERIAAHTGRKVARVFGMHPSEIGRPARSREEAREMMCEQSPYERFVVELVGIFDALDDTERTETGGWGSHREAAENDWKTLTLDELIYALMQTDEFLEAFSYIVTEVPNSPATTAISDARTRTRTALRRAQEFKERAQA